MTPLMTSSRPPRLPPLDHSNLQGLTFTPAAARRLKAAVVILACALGLLVGIGSAELSMVLFGESRVSSSLVGLQEMQELLDRSARETVESLSATAENLPEEKPE